MNWLARHVQGFVPGGKAIYAGICQGPCAVYYLGRLIGHTANGTPVYAAATQCADYPFTDFENNPLTIGFSGQVAYPPGISNYVTFVLRNPVSGMATPCSWDCCQGELKWDGASKWTGSCGGISLEMRVASSVLYLKVVGGCTPTTEVTVSPLCVFPLRATANFINLQCCEAGFTEQLTVVLTGYGRRNAIGRHVAGFVPGGAGLFAIDKCCEKYFCCNVDPRSNLVLVLSNNTNCTCIGGTRITLTPTCPPGCCDTLGAWKGSATICGQAATFLVWCDSNSPLSLWHMKFICGTTNATYDNGGSVICHPLHVQWICNASSCCDGGMPPPCFNADLYQAA